MTLSITIRLRLTPTTALLLAKVWLCLRQMGWPL